MVGVSDENFDVFHGGLPCESKAEIIQSVSHAPPGWFSWFLEDTEFHWSKPPMPRLEISKAEKRYRDNKAGRMMSRTLGFGCRQQPGAATTETVCPI